MLENDNGEVGPNVLWDTMKTLLEGKLFHIVHKKKERQIKINIELKELEAQHKRNPNTNLTLKLKRVRKEIDATCYIGNTKDMVYTKQIYGIMKVCKTFSKEITKATGR